MVKNRQGIADVGFAPPAGTPAGVEVLSLRGLHARAGGGVLTVVQRPAFHHLVTLGAGTLRHTVDFTAHTVGPGGWLWVRPGQVQQWGDLRAADGTLILFEPDFLDPATAAAAGVDDPHAPVRHEPAEPDRAALTAAAGHLAATFATAGHLPLELRQAVLRHLLAVVVLRLAAASTASAPAAVPGTFLAFRDAVERDFTRTRRVEDYARALGWSARTLSRATLAAAGVNAKDFIDRRTVLEARRLLAHSDRTAAQIAAGLGFTSATNFSKFFVQRTGSTPIAFRAGVRSSSKD